MSQRSVFYAAWGSATPNFCSLSFLYMYQADLSITSSAIVCHFPPACSNIGRAASIKSISDRDMTANGRSAVILSDPRADFLLFDLGAVEWLFLVGVVVSEASDSESELISDDGEGGVASDFRLLVRRDIAARCPTAMLCLGAAR